MEKIKFITGNKNKFKEVQDVIDPLILEQVNLDLDEIQELDDVKVIEHKMLQALQQIEPPFFIEDSCLFFECWDYKLPGPFIKWFQQVVSNQDFFNLVQKLGKDGAKGVCTIGYADKDRKLHYFKGEHFGKIVAPRGEKDFGYGPIFMIPETGRTFGEMDRPEKYKYSGRSIASRKLKDFLLKQHE